MSIFTKFSPEFLLSSLLAGIIAGLVALVSCVSFAALIFHGPLTPYLSTGISIAISTAVIGGSVLTLFSTCRPVVAIPDDDTAPVLALMVTLLIALFPAGTPLEVQFVTAFAALALSALTTGVALTLLGFFRLGSLVRFLPYSVMGGYFAGVGLLLIQGALRVVTDLPLLTPASFVQLFSPNQFPLWLPAFASAIAIRLGIGYLNKSIAMPAILAILIAAYYAGNGLLGHGPHQLMTNGLLMGPFPETETVFVRPILLQRLPEVNWGLVFGSADGIATIIMLSSVSLMLTASGLSLVQRENININRELEVAGVANAVSGLSGGLLTLPSMTLSTLAHTVGAPKTRLVGLVVAAFCALIMMFFMGAIAWLPKAVVGGLLLFLGWSFLERWLIEARLQLPLLEYGVVLVIVAVVAFAGFLEGVFFGLICAIMLFVVNYSRINVVRYAMTGEQRRSNVDRNSKQSHYLQEAGGQSFMLKLQGYLFFGTAAALGTRIEQRLEDKSLPKLRFVAMDFAQVTGMDSSAALSFMKLAQQAARSDFFLILTGLSAELEERLKSSWFEGETTSYMQLLPDLDRGVEWIEERILKEAGMEEECESILTQLSRVLPMESDLTVLLKYLEERQVNAGDVLAEQGKSSDELFLLESCTASVYLGTASDRRHRIRRAGSGTVFGEVGFYLGSPRTATVVVDSNGKLFVLNQDKMALLEQEHPQIAAAVHKFMIRVITQRLQLTTATLQAVLT
ncbi:cyclic nucleotide-binding domain-containing protein [Seongchinamella unica]|uniref:Cyclic nucleotide-binding domain-containing protein n=1 Tax=Seongchinamella unica TaxID=2547392 RepID=A0A4R5LPL7_9GAMM|nr:SulP family inorganic anion transporter [Seongchinamella unica]TDG12419.1 cyclic nucleotide-binding domain-containing protein [Seongchinamella unica]